MSNEEYNFELMWSEAYGGPSKGQLYGVGDFSLLDISRLSSQSINQEQIQQENYLQEKIEKQQEEEQQRLDERESKNDLLEKELKEVKDLWKSLFETHHTTGTSESSI